MQLQLFLSLAAFLHTTTALPQATPTPTPTPIPWATKVAALRAHVLAQPTSLDNAGWSKGPAYQVPFPDGDCHQIRLYNWDCSDSIPYKMSAIAAWIDSSDFASLNYTRFEDLRWYSLGYYRDPDDGWAFYDVARMTFGACGNRGPQSACGHVYCTDVNGGQYPGSVPAGATPWVNPNNRDRVCPWLREGKSVGGS